MWLAHSPLLKSMRAGSIFFLPSLNDFSSQRPLLAKAYIRWSVSSLVRPCPDTLRNSLEQEAGVTSTTLNPGYQCSPLAWKTSTAESLNQSLSVSSTLPQPKELSGLPLPCTPVESCQAPAPPGVSWDRDQALGHSLRVLRFPLSGSESSEFYRLPLELVCYHPWAADSCQGGKPPSCRRPVLRLVHRDGDRAQTDRTF